MIDVETIFDSDREEYEFMQQKKEQPMKEQIEEMDTILREIFGCQFAYKINFEKYGGFGGHEEIYTEDIAEALYNAGYRKQSEPISCGHEKGGGWISVDERLPEEGVMVLGHIHTKYKSGGEIDSILTMERKGKYWIPFNCSPVNGCSIVAHWMPLPEPPKMKGGAE